MDSYEKALRKIKFYERCKPTCCIGPTGPVANTTSYFCVDQMRNVIQQIITLYPNDNIIVAMESGNNASGRPGSLLPGPTNNPNSGLFQLANNQGVPEEALSLCRIAAITYYQLQHHYQADAMRTMKMPFDHICQ